MPPLEHATSIEMDQIANRDGVAKKPYFPPPSEWRPPSALTPAQTAKSSKRPGQSAQDALFNFEPGSTDDLRSERLENADDAKKRRVAHAEVLEDFKKSSRNLSSIQKSFTWTSPFAFLPKSKEAKLGKEKLESLMEVAHYAFPQRMELPVLICDIRMDDAVISERQLKDVESFWKQRHADVIIRWIHVPLGNGVVHSSIEDMFRHDQPAGRPFHNAGPPGFPFLDLDSIQFRAIDDLEHMREVHKVLHKHTELRDCLTKRCTENDRNVTLKDDLNWRLTHLGKSLDYWDLALSDIPLELTESFSSGGGEGPLRPPSLGKGPLDPSVLAKNVGQFEGSHLVWAPFRCFHRNDGTLLTMSASTGVDLLHRDFQTHIQETLADRLRDPAASVIGNLMDLLEKRGARDWHELTVEYFLVYLVSEIGVTPTNMSSGHSGPSLLSSLQNISRDLKSRRYERWVPKKSENLVKDNIIFLDELRALSLAYKRRIDFFENLARDVEEHGKSYGRASIQTQANDPNGKTAKDRVEWALTFNKNQRAAVDTLLVDTAQALEPLSYIKQNQLAVHDDRRNKAILIFTMVTIIFLPLSFFSSYFGMNLKGLRKTNLGENFFWELFGPLTAAVVFFVGTWAFWDYITNKFASRRDRPNSRGSSPEFEA